MYNNNVIKIENLGKMYKLYKNPKDKIMDAFGLNFWKKDYYKEFWALRGINIQIKRGERVGLIGHNGAGKSTMLKIIIGNIQPSEGSIKIEGNIQALMELGTGFHPDFTGKENIWASLAYHGLSSGEIKDKEEEIIEFAELGNYIEQPVKTYSAGMYARLAFSTATAIEPEVLIIDEVLGAGDAYFSGKCIERMKELTGNRDTTVLFVSHDLASVQALCERIIWIDKGKVRYDGDPLTAIKAYSDVVRENQENRLKIRDRKVQKKQAVILDKEEELYDTFLLRICPGDGELKAKVRKIVLLLEEKPLAEIEVGMPMDNDNKDKNYILDERKKMCWGDAKKDEKGFYRMVDSRLGEYGHAPFMLSIPKAKSKLEGLRLKLEGELVEGSSLHIDIYDKTREKYVLLEELKKGQTFESKKIKFFCPWMIETQADYQDSCSFQRDKEIEFQDSEQCKITSACIYDQNQNMGQVFPFENQISKFEFHVHFSKEIEQFTIAFLIFTMRGDIVISQCQEVQAMKDKEFNIEIQLGDIRMGAGVYTVSFGVYEELQVLDNSKPQSAIALIDRGLSFEIEEPLHYHLNMGNVIPNFKFLVNGQKKGEGRCNSLI